MHVLYVSSIDRNSGIGDRIDNAYARNEATSFIHCETLNLKEGWESLFAPSPQTSFRGWDRATITEHNLGVTVYLRYSKASTHP